MPTLWHFTPLDTLFFRDGRPFDAGETQAATSRFPPSGYTLQGAVRTALLRGQGVDPAAFARAAQGRAPAEGQMGRLLAAIGNADGLGNLRLCGPFVTCNRELLFAAPLDLYRAKDGLGRLQPGPPVPCDLGAVRLPTAVATGIKPLEGYWLPAGAMARLLAGALSLAPADLFPLFPPKGRPRDALAGEEYRIGLARDNQGRTARSGLLYSATRVRLREGVGLAVVVDGLDPGLLPAQTMVQQLGGEGRLAELAVVPAPSGPGDPLWPTAPPLSPADGILRFRLILTTPALLHGEAPGEDKPGWLPRGFTRTTAGGATVWRGELGGVRLTIVSGCISKAVRLGGWDLARGEPRPLEPLIPAGSVYFCEADSTQRDAVLRLHGAQIGQRTEYGFGHVLLGCW